MQQKVGKTKYATCIIIIINTSRYKFVYLKYPIRTIQDTTIESLILRRVEEKNILESKIRIC